MAGVFGRRALYTDANQAKHTFVSLDGFLEKRQTRGGNKKRQTRGGDKTTSLIFEGISDGGFLDKCGIRNGDRLISVNFAPANDVSFDLLIDTIRDLTPLALGVERTSDDGKVVTIMVFMEIRTESNHEPYLKFHGLHFWKDEGLDTDTIIKYLPIHIEPYGLYRYYDEVVVDVAFKGDDSYWLTVDGSDVKLHSSKDCNDKALFTMYKYTKWKGEGRPVILVPQKDPKHCLAGAEDNTSVELVEFDETEWTNPDEDYKGNKRFLLLVKVHEHYKIERSMGKAGNYIAKGSNNEAEWRSKNYIHFSEEKIFFSSSLHSHRPTARVEEQ